MIDADLRHPTLLVGSFPYRDARETLTVSGPLLAGVAKRLSDGEAQGWTIFAARSIPSGAGIEPDDDFTQLPNRRIQMYRVRNGATAADIRFEPAGYEDIVISSYAVFRELRDAGVIAPGTRLQQSLPTPLGVIGQHFGAQDIPVVLDAFQAAHFADVRRLLERVPHRDLALQWDVAVEVISSLERRDPVFAELYPLEAVANLVAQAVDAIPLEVEVGIHLCYGNPGGHHIQEPYDLANVVELANAVAEKVHRRLNWVHMPVPIDRDDAAYFAPLRALRLAGDTEFYLGLVHLGDGVEGGTRRIRAASTVCSSFGIATECGFRYVPAADVPTLLELHRQLGRVN
jgi:hypothetical protein